ncbi:hypothetical protein AAF712_001031 [Marasmius tenuissimus]|uniref:Uncharacterized protein n=1 Tax=Marasmius tenuissimus TaxID=585030 RepID=A0ABR3AGH5_9AGAR
MEAPQAGQEANGQCNDQPLPPKGRAVSNNLPVGNGTCTPFGAFGRLRKVCPISGARPHSATGESLLRTTSGQHIREDAVSRTAAQRPFSAAPSSYSRISRYMPNMQLFRKVIKDELWYTTAITFTFVISAVLAYIGVNIGNNIPVVGWVGLTWAIMSVLAMHSFDRVIARREREALLQQAFMESSLQRRFGRSHQGISTARRGSHSTSDFEILDSPFLDSWRVDRSPNNSAHSESRGSKSPASSLSSFNNLSITVPVCIPSPIAVPESARAPYTPWTPLIQDDYSIRSVSLSAK